jgi:hypothetical protein
VAQQIPEKVNKDYLILVLGLSESSKMNFLFVQKVQKVHLGFIRYSQKE